IQKQHERALELLEQSRCLFLKLGHRRGFASAALSIGNVLLEMNQPESALPYAQESRTIAEELEDRKCQMHALEVLARIAGGQGELESALQLFRQSFTIAQEFGDTRHIATVLFHSGTLLASSTCLEKAYLKLSLAAREFEAKGMSERNEVEGT